MIRSLFAKKAVDVMGYRFARIFGSVKNVPKIQTLFDNKGLSRSSLSAQLSDLYKVTCG